MSTYFSDHFATTGIATTLAGTTTYDAQKRIDPGSGHGRLRTKRARITIGTAAQIGDVLRMMQFKSGDRIEEIFVSSSGGSAGAADIGLYKSGHDHDGAAIDVDLFSSAVTLSGTVAHVDEFKESTTLKDIDRGQPLWFLADIGDGTYTADPFEDWDLCLTITTAITVSLMTIVVDVKYTAND